MRNADGGLRIIYVTQDTGVGGGHRDVFEHLNRLCRARPLGRALLVSPGRPTGFHSRLPCATFETYEELSRRRWRASDAIKVATWWATAPPVWRASVTRGIPVYFVQDIETSYYPGDPSAPRPASWPATARSSAT